MKQKRRKIEKREGRKLKMEGGKVTECEERTFFFSKTTEICFGSTKMGIFFFTGKKHYTPGKKSGKMTLPHLKNFPLTPLSERPMAVV